MSGCNLEINVYTKNSMANELKKINTQLSTIEKLLLKKTELANLEMSVNAINNDELKNYFTKTFTNQKKIIDAKINKKELLMNLKDKLTNLMNQIN